MKEIADLKKQDAIVAIVGNKLDLPNKEVSTEDVEGLIKETGSILSTMSAKSGDGVEYFFEQLFNEMSRVFNLSGPDQEELNVTEKFDLGKIKQTTKQKRKCCKN
eukprot:CAMPEP_0170529630 /NCGR_PEP_ID=MMETSP0209-20121228/27306_1 /TAXON_ID=665100 ORGANISM="Litonotus pictus, Strain P1" /NCGR_SAMPLE_ID=MMETSP0209 /ASSEMBLY_ACC=CAM_ASM_000301 /LENGTH=104 /DNA_ID=CAMNT_0010821817 /DNA_START=380 /DNA_END=694 /DNA_ORIENTATION=-